MKVTFRYVAKHNLIGYIFRRYPLTIPHGLAPTAPSSLPTCANSPIGCGQSYGLRSDQRDMKWMIDECGQALSCRTQPHRLESYADNLRHRLQQRYRLNPQTQGLGVTCRAQALPPTAAKYYCLRISRRYRLTCRYRGSE